MEVSAETGGIVSGKDSASGDAKSSSKGSDFESRPILNGFSNGIEGPQGGEHKQKDKHGSSSSKDKDRGHHHHHKDKHKEKSHKSDSHKHKHKDKDKDREHSKEHKHSSSSSKRDGESGEKEKSGSSEKENKDKHRDKERSEKSGSSSKEHKHHSNHERSHSKEGKHHHKDKDREKDRERKDKEKLSSSLSTGISGEKDKSSGSSESKEKHKSHHKSNSHDKEKNREHKSKHSHDKPKHKDEDKKTEVAEIKREPGDGSFSAARSPPPSSPVKIKQEVQLNAAVKQETTDDDDIPLANRAKLKEKNSSGGEKKRKVKEEVSDEDDLPLMSKLKKAKKEHHSSGKDISGTYISGSGGGDKKKKKRSHSDDEDEDFKVSKKSKPSAQKAFKEEPLPSSPKKGGRQKKEEEPQEVWKWWEEEKKDDGVKWKFLQHKGPIFAPPYDPLPKNVKFYYNGQQMQLSPETEEIATFYGRMLDHDYTTMEKFNTNFFKDWRKTMNSKEKEIITDLKKCNFNEINDYFKMKTEERKARSKEEKQEEKKKVDALTKEYGFCSIDGHKEKIGNFKIEPPGLFRGRGDHPKMGMLKRRVMPEDIIINCSKDSVYPKAPDGHKWKEVRNDNTVTWLAAWTENVQGQIKYIMLNPSSKLKGEKDWQKYEVARRLHTKVGHIREQYKQDWKSKEMRIRQRAVALYFIDKLALRAGNEKDEDQADTVGCCSLRFEHIKLHEERNGQDNVVEFDFLGKDSIRYNNEVAVEKRVFKNLQLFMENKQPGDDLFDRLNTQIMNQYLNNLMEGLTAKVFRTYNASITLQEQLNKLTDPNDDLPAKILAYNRANRAVAILCNHQRSVPKSHEKSMENLNEKISEKREQLKEAEKQYKQAKKEAKRGEGSVMALDKKKKAVERIKQQLTKLEIQATDRDENKTIALGTSKLNYLDPRISVAWCKKHNVPLDKIYNKTHRAKFNWAIDMAGPDFVF